MGLRVFIVIAVIIAILTIGITSVVRAKADQDADSQTEIIKKLDEVLKNQETIKKDLKYIINKIH